MVSKWLSYLLIIVVSVFIFSWFFFIIISIVSHSIFEAIKRPDKHISCTLKSMNSKERFKEWTTQPNDKKKRSFEARARNARIEIFRPLPWFIDPFSFSSLLRVAYRQLLWFYFFFFFSSLVACCRCCCCCCSTTCRSVFTFEPIFRAFWSHVLFDIFH